MPKYLEDLKGGSFLFGLFYFLGKRRHSQLFYYSNRKDIIEWLLWCYQGQICITFGANLASRLLSEMHFFKGAIWNEFSQQHQQQNHILFETNLSISDMPLFMGECMRQETWLFVLVLLQVINLYLCIRFGAFLMYNQILKVKIKGRGVIGSDIFICIKAVLNLKVT